ncbi:MAG: ABC transporter ATP-binding protein [Candidatus Acidiferrales bacterium]
MSQPVIRAENLKKYFPPARAGWKGFLQPFLSPTQRALDGVSFEIERGEIVALIGGNGAGKSTLLRILATLLIPTGGEAWVKGFQIERDAVRVREKIGYHAGGDEGFYSRLTARENLRLFATMNNMESAASHPEIARVAKFLGLEEALDRQVRTLSTGIVHRLGLARALLHGPDVLLLDEPTRSLDPLAANEFRQFLKERVVRAQGVTLFFASHILSEVEQIADRVILLEHGSLLSFDTPRMICEKAGAETLVQALEILIRRSAPAGNLS